MLCEIRTSQFWYETAVKTIGGTGEVNKDIVINWCNILQTKTKTKTRNMLTKNAELLKK